MRSATRPQYHRLQRILELIREGTDPFRDAFGVSQADRPWKVRLLFAREVATCIRERVWQPPCSAGRMKHRRVYYLGLLGPVTNGQANIADLYTAKFGTPAPGQKVFIVTCQTRNGWKAQDSVFSAIIPPPALPAKQQVPPKSALTTEARTAKPQSASAPAEPSSSVSPAVYKRSTPDARGMLMGQPGVQPVSISRTPLVHGLRVALRRLGMLGMFGARAEGGALG